MKKMNNSLINFTVRSKFYPLAQKIGNHIFAINFDTNSVHHSRRRPGGSTIFYTHIH
jgi:hypothetical protein